MDQTEWKEEALVLNYSQLLKFAKLIFTLGGGLF